MEPTASEIKSKASSAKEYATEKARQVASEAQDQLEKGESIVQDYYEMARERAEDALDVSVDFIKKHPISTIAGAAAIGIVAGFLLRRK